MDQRPLLLANRCKRRGGDCPCKGDCQAERALHKRLTELDSEKRQLKSALEKITTKPATVRGDWTLPIKPAGDGWCPHWYSEKDDPDCVDFPSGRESWPFEENYAYADDWERAGFQVA